MENIEVVRSTFQAVISKFIADRDNAVAKINRVLNTEGNEDVEKILIKQMKKLSKAKINIWGTEQELNNILNRFSTKKTGE